MITKMALMKRYADAFFACWASVFAEDSPISVDRIEYESVMKRRVADTQVLDGVWDLLKERFSATEMATGIFNFPSDMIARAESFLKKTRKKAPDLVDSINLRVKALHRLYTRMNARSLSVR